MRKKSSIEADFYFFSTSYEFVKIVLWASYVVDMLFYKLNFVVLISFGQNLSFYEGWGL